MRRVLVPLIALCVLCTAEASVAVKASVEELTALCDVVVEGAVLDHATALDGAAGAIWTSFRVRVERSIAGDAAGDVTVRIRGGRIGTVEQETLGAPKLADGEHVVLFLAGQVRDAREVVGLAQGVFHVETDTATGAASCSNSLDGLSIVDLEGKGVTAEPLRLSLVELRARVVTARDQIENRRRAVREATDRRFAQWRRAALRHAEMSRGKPGGAPN